MRPDRVTKRLLVVDGDEAVTAWLSRALSEDFALAPIRNDGSLTESIQKSAARSDLALLCIDRYDDASQALLGAVSEALASCQTPIVLVTDQETSAERLVCALEAGARDVVARAQGTRLLMARVRSVLRDAETIEGYRLRITELTQSENLRLQSLRMAAHDLKTPINNVRIAESILRLTAPKRKEVTQSLNMIRLMTANMNDIINNFVGLFEVRAGQLRIQLAPFYLPETVNDLISDYEFAAAQKHIRLNNSVDDGWVIGDAPRLRQALGNLLGNAIKYSPSDSEVKIYAFRRGGCIYIMVEDQGSGIPRAEREELYRMFGELSPRPSTGESSTGLGLWIVDHLIKAQNGTVGAKFPESGGSRFWVSLPEYTALDSAAAGRLSALAADPAASAKGATVALTRSNVSSDSETGG